MLDAIAMLSGVFLIAFMFAPIGMGGGMLFVPLFHYLAGWPIDGTLLAVSLSLTWAVSIGSGLRHRKEGFHHPEATKSVLYGAVLGALIGVGIVNALGDGLDTAFKLLSIVMLVWALVRTWEKQRGSNNSERDEETTQQPMSKIPLRVGGSIGGALSSVLGIGAGVVYVPVLQQQAGLGPRTAVGSSLSIMMIVVPVAIIALLTSDPQGLFGGLEEVPWWVLILPALAYAGATTGAKFGIENISKENIMNIFMFMVAVVLVRYTVDVASITMRWLQ
jgi:uncharacterized membrane protein YfcA